MKNYVTDVILPRVERQNGAEHSLIVFNSYGPHLQAQNDPCYSQHHMHFACVPKRMTPILQPVDVVINSPFHAFYNDKYESYMQVQLELPEVISEERRPKVPDAQQVATWITEFCRSKDEAFVKRAFTACGITPRSEFSIEHLYASLKELYSMNFDQQECKTRFGNLLADFANFDESMLVAPYYYVPNRMNSIASIFQCLQKAFVDSKAVHAARIYRDEFIIFMKTMPELVDVCDADYHDSIQTYKK